MTNFHEMSDLEINKAVAKIQGIRLAENQPSKKSVVGCYFDYSGWHTFDYCNNPADAWPIVVENRIMLNPFCANDEWKAQKWLRKDADNFDKYASCWDSNPLRAAMIAYLMMQEDV